MQEINLRTEKFGKKLLSAFVALAVTASMMLPMGMGLTAKAAGTTSGSWGDSGNYDTGWYDNNSGESSFTITTAAQLAGLAKKVNSGTNFSGKTITLDADIDLSAHFWVPIGNDYNDTTEFAGTFNGEDAQGVKHVIKGLKIGTSDSPDRTFDDEGFFSFINYASIINVSLTGITIYTDCNDDGGLVGLSVYSTIKGCTVSGSITSIGYSRTVGGLVGYYGFAPSSIENCSSSCSVTSSWRETCIGGLVGQTEQGPSASTCCATGDVSSSGESNYVGGLIGQADGSISESYATGNVSGTGSGDYIGGLVGNSCSQITNCCFFKGTVTGTGSCVGGLAGNVGWDISTSYSASGNINASGSVGGLVGSISTYATGDTGCYFDTDTTGHTNDGSNGSATALTTRQMQGADALSSNNMSGFGASDWTVTSVASCGADYYPIPAAFSTLSVNYDSEGGAAVSPASVPFYSTVTQPTPERAGYTFGGWYTDETFTQPFSANTRIISSITLYAKWTVNRYALHFNSQGGTSEANQSVTYDSQVGTLPSPSRDGYTFIGWFTRENGQGTQYTQNTSYHTANDTTLYANWSANSYALHFDSQGGSSEPDKSVTYDTQVGALPTPTRDHYTFGGWFTQPGGHGSQYTPNTSYTISATEGTTLYADWVGDSYPITYNLNGGTNSGSNTATYTYATGLVLNSPTRDGYTFGGWFSDSAFTTRVSSISNAQTDRVTLYAKWSVNSYTLHFDSQGGTSADEQSVTYDSLVGMLPSPSRDGYTFGGWFTGENGQGTQYTQNTSYHMANDTTLYAMWSANSYTLHFDSQGGTSEASQSVTYDSPVGLLSSPTKTGYTFMGWFTGENGGGTQYSLDTSYHTANDTTVYAKWSANSYTLHFDSQGGSSENDKSVNYDAPVGSLPTPTRDHYTFGGWFTQPGGHGSPYTQDTAYTVSAAEGTTIYADWLPKTVTKSSATFDLSNTVLPSGVTSVSAVVSTEPSSASEAQSVSALLKSNSALGSSNNFVLYDLKLLDQNGNAITFTGSVTVRLPVPQGMTNPHVYWFDGTSLHDMNATVQDGYLVFTTTHFSYYTVAQVSTAARNPKTGANDHPALPTEIAGAFAILATGAVIFKKTRLTVKKIKQ